MKKEVRINGPHHPNKSGSQLCICGRTISANKPFCAACVAKLAGAA